MVETDSNVKPKVPQGYEAVLIKCVPHLFGKEYFWGVYPLPPKKIDDSAFCTAANVFLLALPPTC